MFSIFSLIIFSLNYNSRVESAIDVIGNYKQLNPKNCGVSRLSPQVNTNCFEWHKELLPSLKNARNITIGEAPWMALIAGYAFFTIRKSNETFLSEFLCGGSLIANQWILTAAHCLVGDREQSQNIEGPIEIFFGYDFVLTPYTPEPNISFKSNEWFIHPNYNTSDKLQRYDIALIKLNKPINSTVYGIKSENNICLPERRQKFNKNEGQMEYGMLAGWSTREPVYEPHFRLQMSYWRIKSNTVYSVENDLLYVEKLDNQLVCQGDSGSPLWQYHNGRAVIIGILSYTKFFDNTTGCMMEVLSNNTAIPFIATPVSTSIDWIISVSELN